MITQEYLQETFIYLEGRIYRRKNFDINKPLGETGARTKKHYHIRILSKFYTTSHVIFMYHHGYFPTRLNHVNSNTKDNRIENLRECTPIEMVRYSNKRSDNTSGFKGVSWNKKASKWEAYIYLPGKRISLGRFPCRIAAAKAYNRAALLHFGEFAQINTFET